MATMELGYAAFYRLMRAISEIDGPLESGDFCLLDRRVVDALGAQGRGRDVIMGRKDASTTCSSCRSPRRA